MNTTYRKNIDLSEKKKLLLKQLLQKETAAHASPHHDAGLDTHPVVRPRVDRECHPLSLTQQRLWKLEQFVPGKALRAAFHLAGRPDLYALEQALQELVQRHEILRAVFLNQDDRPVQRILPAVAVRLSRVDLSAQISEEAACALDDLLDACQNDLFNVSKGPLFKAGLVCLSEFEHLFILATHPLLADNATLTLLGHELIRIYRGATSGKRANLPECSLTYADYAGWQQEHSQGTVLKEQQYWKQQLAGATLTLNLPLDQPRAALAHQQQKASTKVLDASLIRRVSAFCADKNLSLEDCCFAALVLLLNRYTSQTDLVIGRSSATRAQELEHVAGPFATTQPVRVQLNRKTTGQTFVQQVHQMLLAANRSQGLPLESIVEAVYPQHDLTREPLFQASFVFQQVPSFADLSAQLLPLRPTQPFQDLSFVCQQSTEQLALSIFYDGNLFDAASIERLHGHYIQLLVSLVGQPTLPLEALSCLTLAEHTQILSAWNAATLDEPLSASLCLHHLFEQQVEHTPQAIALSDGQQRLTYRELNERANQLAHLLLRRGIGPEQFVGLCLSRSFDLIIGQMAILKAGAAYVPLDPSYPRDRLDFTIQDAGLNVILTEQDLLARMPFSPEQALCLDLPGLYVQESTTNIALEMHNDHLAYVIYTSGSTGRPKGVCIRHRNAVVFMQWARQEFSAGELAGVLFGTSICFDLSIFEVFAPLSWGGKVILATTVLDLPHLAARERITLLNTVPSAASALLNNGDLPSSLLTINLAGEALARDLVHALYQRTTAQRVCNLYGPTEDTTYSTGATMKADQQGAVTIGRPLVNTQAYIVDAQMQPVPVGVAGELYLGGDGQARGYLKRPDLTAERFVPDPFSDVPGSRLYRTGDLARYRPDGNIDYLGRLDHQVKVRGFRIELGEIEAHLRQHPAVADVVVVAMEVVPGEKCLVAYVVAHSQQACDIARLRQYLQDRVPVYMVPTFFMPLKSLPQTVNGKVDRKALPAPRATKMQATPLQPELAPILVQGARSILPDTPVPLGFAQRHFWYADLLENGNARYNVPLVLELAGSFQRLALYQALREIIRRHETLRTTIRVVKGNPFQFISEKPDPDFTILDLEAALNAYEYPSGEQLSQHPLVQAEMLKEIQGAFDLARGPLLRIRLLRLRAGYHILLLSMHHAITDGWSLNILTEELRTLYAAFSAGLPSPLPALPVYYRDFAVWQREQQVAHFAADLAYWKEYFSPLPPSLELPYDYPRPVVQSSEGKSLRFQYSQELSQRLLELSQQEGVTLFVTLLSAFLVLLAHHSGQEDIVVGTPVANRSHPELESLLGCFVNTLALRADLEGNPTGCELLHRVLTLVQEAFNHQAVPFAEVVEAIQPPRDPSRTLLFQVYFLLQNVPTTPLFLPDVRVERIEAASPVSQYDLSFLMEDHPAGLSLKIEYKTQLFAETTIERFQTHYQDILLALCEQPEMPIQDLALLVPATGSREATVPETRSEAGGEKRRDLLRTTRSGIHHKKSALPEQCQASEPVVDDSPQSVLERTIARIWQNVLKMPRIEHTENFFEIGGHSLLAMQVLAAIREELHIAISVRQFFTVPTIAEQVALIEAELAVARTRPEIEASSFPPLVPVERVGDFPLSFAQQRLWFLDQLEGSSATYNIPVVLQLTGELNISVLQSCVREIVRRHEALRTVFPRGQRIPVQCVQMLPLVPVEFVDFSSCEPGDLQTTVLQDVQTEVQRPFDLESGPLLRTRVLRLSHEKHIVIFVMHHIVSDGWSMAVLAQELNALYNAFVAGKPSPLPELKLQYGDFVAWQCNYLQGPRLEAHLDYWRKQLGGAAILKLPTDHARSAAYSAPGAKYSAQWSQSFAQQLQAFSQQEDLTLFMTLLAAFQMLLACYSGQDDITVGSPVANRSHPALEPLVGFFVNTLALRTSFVGNPTVREVLQRVREVTLGAYDHQDIPFEQVVEAVHPERQPGISPLFQVFFVLQNNAPTEIALTNLQVQSIEMHTATAKFDLAVSLEMNSAGPGFSIEYNTQLFERSTIQQMQERYRLLLEQCMANPEIRLADLYVILARESTGDN